MPKYIFAFFAGMVDNLGVFEYQSHFCLCKGMPADYSGKNLRGRSFKGQDLTGADFSGADIRGTNFTNAILVGANFSLVKAGLQKQWAAFLLVVSFVISGVSGFFSAYAGGLVSLIFDAPNQSDHIAGWVGSVILIILFILIIRQGFNSAFAFAFAGAVAFAALVAVGLIGAIAVAFAGAVAVTFAVAFAGVVAGAVAVVVAVAVAFAVAVAGVFAGDVIGDVVVAVAVAFAVALLSAYIVWYTLKGDEKYALIRKAAITFAAFGGTSFYNANLIDANFTGATLKSTDLRKATITRTRFHKSKKLDRVRPGDTYLAQFELLNILVTGNGADKNFDYKDLKGVNLQGAILTDMIFIGANLSEANLQDADLSRAKLAQTQLDGTDFTGATLTGAYIEDWGITSTTKFDGVRCGWVYMQLPTKENPDPMRKPDNRQEVFKDGEFGDFIKPIFDTLDLYHSQGVDPRAVAISFKQLSENNPDAELRIVGMEVRGDENFLLRVKTAVAADKSELSAEYFALYNEIKALVEKEIKALIAEKDNRISSLENMISTALQQPRFYSQTQIEKVDSMSHETYQTKYDQKGAQIGGIVDTAASGSNVQITQNNNAPLQQNNLVSSEANNFPAKTILILAANPKDTTNLRLDEEVREIDAGLQRAKKRELFKLEQRWAVRVNDVYQALLEFKPQIVHFSGHGEGSGLALEDDAGMFKLVETEALAKLFGLFANDIECVVLNACYSEVQADAIAQYIPYVIGMNKQIGDKAAIKFATGFYSALSSGKSVEFAYELGCNVIQLDGIDEHLTPLIKKKQQSDG